MKVKKIDESLYSRQLYVIGKDAMEKMMTSKILIVGMDGLGQEVAKNLCLMGVSNIWIYDKEEVKEEDLITGFYFKREHIGRIRDVSVLHRFRSLNEHVHVRIADNLEEFDKYNLVIVCNEQIDKQIEYNRQTRRSNCKFISCQVRGLFSQLFCDFGTDFVCLDQNGEMLVTGMINDITSDGILTVVDEQRHNLEDGDIIKILNKEEYEGFLFKVTSVGKSSVQLRKIDGISVMEIENESTKAFDFPEVYGGDFEQVKKPKMLHFRSLEEAIEDLKIISFNFGGGDREQMIHKCFIALSDYLKSFGVFPNANNLLSYFIKRYQNLYDAEPLIREFGRQCDTTIMPMCSIVGGVAAQEAIKAISHKFNPIKQFLYFDALDAVPENVEDYDTNGEGYGRYAPLVRIFGRESVAKLFNLNLFVVGSGAIGCEHLKNLVMCGMGTNGEICVTDMDSIEQSNLTRQFLFSRNDVSKMKAEVAVREIKNLNEDFANGFHKDQEQVEEQQPSQDNTSTASPKRHLDSVVITKKSKEAGFRENLKYFNLKVGEETEEVFSDTFFQNIDIIANALDNVEARLYMDKRSLLSKKHLVDAGTSGTKGNVQTVVPFFSEPYSASHDPPERTIPICTMKNFPYAIEHTIEWAMSEFKDCFHDQILSIKEFIEDPLSFEEDEVIETIDEITKIPTKANQENIRDKVKKAPRTPEGCIKAGLSLFIRYFHSSIQDLLTSLPPGCKTKEGLPFWMPPKRPPTPINFDIDNDLHVTFVQSVANIYSYNFGINSVISKERVIDYITNDILDTESLPLKFPPIVKEEDMPLDTSKFVTAEFEKDDDSNFHVDFIYSCANLRATNYKIKNQNRLTIKGIAGRIIPAIATTTSVVSGLAVIEMIKMGLNVANSKYKNYFLNLALPFFASTDPLEAPKLSYEIDGKKFTFTVWNTLEYKDTKLSNILKAFEIQFKTPLTMVSIGNRLIYWNIDEKYKNNLDKKISEIVPKVDGKLYIPLEAITDKGSEDYEVDKYDKGDKYPRILVLYD